MRQTSLSTVQTDRGYEGGTDAAVPQGERSAMKTRPVQPGELGHG